MRVVSDFTKDGIKITLFDWNNKYLLKFEAGGMEQTFKIAALDVTDESDLEELAQGTFFDQVKERFDEMNQSLQKAMKNF
jgi:NADP-dependent 3-hydroxy acid dehydrogenase YdfG